MKRFLCFVLLYSCFLLIPIKAEETSLKYRIYASEKSKKLIVLKRELFVILDGLCEGVDEESYLEVVEENLDLFKQTKDVKVYLKKDTLYLIYGDGKGKSIQGTYGKENVCYKEVKPKSLLMKWWEKAKQ